MKTDPVIIGCCGSSGSTLLATILTNHSEVFCGPELSLFSKKELYENYKVVKRSFTKWFKAGLVSPGPTTDSRFMSDYDQCHLSEEFLREAISKSDNIREWAHEVFDKTLLVEQKSVFVEKTPTNCYCFNEYLNSFPSGKVIHIVRDGRDVVCSLLKRGYRYYSAIARWLCDVSAGITCSEDARYIQVKYENLVLNPENEIERICCHIGVQYESDMLRRNVSANRKKPQIGSWASSPINDPISSRSVGKYKDELSINDLLYFYSMKPSQKALHNWGMTEMDAGSLLRHLGYDVLERSTRKQHAAVLYRYAGDVIRQTTHGKKTPLSVTIPIRLK
jgi:hypothetical protein